VEGDVSSWSVLLSRRVGSVLASVPGGPLAYDVPDVATPTWLLLPSWLDEAWAKKGSGAPGALPEGVLTDLFWGQYALFLCVRIQDDLLDRERADLALLFVADRFLLESLESFQRFPALDTEFWSFYRSCLRETVDGILTVRQLEARPGGFATEHLALHARVSAIFKLGIAAVCHLHGRTGEIRWLSQLLDGLAIFGQICDDLRDLAPDLRAGRFTWGANTVLGGSAGERSAPEGWVGRLAVEFMRHDWGEPLLQELRRVVDETAQCVPDSAPFAVHELVRKLRARPGALDRGMHEARVRSVFGSDLGLTVVAPEWSNGFNSRS
jgi:hypothetical protein